MRWSTDTNWAYRIDRISLASPKEYSRYQKGKKNRDFALYLTEWRDTSSLGRIDRAIKEDGTFL